MLDIFYNVSLEAAEFNYSWWQDWRLGHHHRPPRLPLAPGRWSVFYPDLNLIAELWFCRSSPSVPTKLEVLNFDIDTFKMSVL